MIILKRNIYLLIIVSFLFTYTSCKQKLPENIQVIEKEPTIEPKYSGVTIPPNIAPLNFFINETGNHFNIKVSSFSGNSNITINSSDGIVKFPIKLWKKLLEENKGNQIKIQVYSYIQDQHILKKYLPFYMYVANEKIDPYLCYRLLYPGYEVWKEMKIMQRSLENFKEKSILENQLIDNKRSCFNCHSFNQNNPNNFLVHIRGRIGGGTYFMEDGNITRSELKMENMPGGATYPSWHPEGRYVAFSSNKVSQSYYSHPEKSIEVYDQISTLIIYDKQKNELFYVNESDSINYMQTFPTWSPDGKYLYFCQARQMEEDISVNTIQHIHYDLARKAFFPESMLFGETEIIFNAAELEKSVSFPRISPDGKNLIFVLSYYGTFSIWHEEADLYLFNLLNGTVNKMDINSEKSESYHSWSSNGKWLVFSSKRKDGRSARPYFAYFKSPDEVGKPFVLPQKDPTLYKRMLKTFNIPEFVIDKITLNPRDFARSSKNPSIQAISGNPDYIPQKLIGNDSKKRTNEYEWKIHE